MEAFGLASSLSKALWNVDQRLSRVLFQSPAMGKNKHLDWNPSMLGTLWTNVEHYKVSLKPLRCIKPPSHHLSPSQKEVAYHSSIPLQSMFQSTCHPFGGVPTIEHECWTMCVGLFGLFAGSFEVCGGLLRHVIRQVLLLCDAVLNSSQIFFR